MFLIRGLTPLVAGISIIALSSCTTKTGDFAKLGSVVEFSPSFKVDSKNEPGDDTGGNSGGDGQGGTDGGGSNGSGGTDDSGTTGEEPWIPPNNSGGDPSGGNPNADFTILSGATEVARVGVDIPEEFKKDDLFLIQFMLPLPKGYYNDKLLNPTTWLGVKNPSGSGAIPLQMRPIYRGPVPSSGDPDVLIVAASAMIKLHKDFEDDQEYKIKVYEGGFGENSKADFLASSAAPTILTELFPGPTTPGQSPKVIAEDTYGNIYFAEIYKSATDATKVISSGPNYVEFSHYTIMQPLTKVGHEYPHMFGVMARTKVRSDEVVELQLQFDNSSANLSGTKLDRPAGPIFFKYLKLLLPKELMARIRFERQYSDLIKCEGSTTPQTCSGSTVPGFRAHDLIGPLTSEHGSDNGKLHLFDESSIHTYDFSLTYNTSDSDIKAKLEKSAKMAGIGYTMPGTNGIGMKYFHWDNPYTPWLGAQFDPIPHFDYKGSNSLQSNFASNYDSLSAAYRNGTNGHSLLTQNHVKDPHPKPLDKYGGGTGGQYLPASLTLATQVAYARSRKGALYLDLRYKTFENRQQNANFKINGEIAGPWEYYNGSHLQGDYNFKYPGPKLSWVDCNKQSYSTQEKEECNLVESFSMNYSGALNYPMDHYPNPDKFGYKDHFDHRHAQKVLIEDRSNASYTATAAKFDPMDMQHLWRATGPIVEAAYLLGSPGAIRSLSMLAAHSMHDYSRYKQTSGNKIFSGHESFANNYPNRGMAFGRAEAWGTLGSATYFGFGDDFYRAEAKRYFDDLSEIFVDAQTACSGIIYSIFTETTESKHIDALGTGGFPNYLRTTQWFEEIYGYRARDAIYKTIYADIIGSDPAAFNYQQVISENAAATLTGDLTWQPNLNGYFRYHANYPCDSDGDPIGNIPGFGNWSGLFPAFCQLPSPNNPNAFLQNPHVNIVDFVTTSEDHNEDGEPFTGTSWKETQTHYSAGPMALAIKWMNDGSLISKLECRLQKMRGGGTSNGDFNDMKNALQSFGDADQNLDHSREALRYVQDLIAQGENNFCQ